MAVKIIDEERIKRTLDRTDHARLSEADVRVLKKLRVDIESSMSKLTEYLNTVEVRMKIRPTPTVEATSRPEHDPHPHAIADTDGCSKDWKELPANERPRRFG